MYTHTNRRTHHPTRQAYSTFTWLASGLMDHIPTTILDGFPKVGRCTPQITIAMAFQRHIHAFTTPPKTDHPTTDPGGAGHGGGAPQGGRLERGARAEVKGASVTCVCEGARGREDKGEGVACPSSIVCWESGSGPGWDDKPSWVGAYASYAAWPTLAGRTKETVDAKNAKRQTRGSIVHRHVSQHTPVLLLSLSLRSLLLSSAVAIDPCPSRHLVMHCLSCCLFTFRLSTWLRSIRQNRRLFPLVVSARARPRRLGSACRPHRRLRAHAHFLLCYPKTLVLCHHQHRYAQNPFHSVPFRSSLSFIFIHRHPTLPNHPRAAASSCRRTCPAPDCDPSRLVGLE